MAPFSDSVAQEFLDGIENGTIPNANALIMISDDMVVSQSLFSKPLIISQVTYDEANALAKYSYNQNSTLTSTMEHIYVERCYLLNVVTPTLLVLAGAWLVVAVSWYILAYHIRKQQAIYLNRILMIIPVCKCLETMINGLFYNACPWLGAQDPGEKYLEMARISIVTIVYTALLALLYIIAKGWQTMFFQMSRNQATSLTMIMGAVYLTFSAYFLSSDFSGISTFMRVRDFYSLLSQGIDGSFVFGSRFQKLGQY